MAPTRTVSTQGKQNGNGVPVRKGVTTRNSAVSSQLTKQPVILKETRIKRKAEASPPKERTTKRSALGNITNVSYLIHYLILILNYQSWRTITF